MRWLAPLVRIRPARARVGKIFSCRLGKLIRLQMLLAVAMAACLLSDLFWFEWAEAKNELAPGQTYQIADPGYLLDPDTGTPLRGALMDRVQAGTLDQTIYDAVFDGVLSGRLRPGERLGELVLADRHQTGGFSVG